MTENSLGKKSPGNDVDVTDDEHSSNMALAPGISHGMDTNHSSSNTKCSIMVDKVLCKSAKVNLKTVHITNLPTDCDYEVLSSSLKSFGYVTEIRMNYRELECNWEAWTTFSTHEEAVTAACNIGNKQICGKLVKGALTDEAPRGLDIYKPSDYETEQSQNQQPKSSERPPNPPMWLIITSKEEKYNYFKFSRYLQKKFGGISSKDISRFGKDSILVHAKSRTQSHMLSLMKVKDTDMVKEIKPHLSFSYGRGVIFDRDLYDFSESEILEMCPPSVWKVKKVPKANMIVLSFNDPDVPSHVVIENLRIYVRPFLPKPLQCFNCFRFGHPSGSCKNNKICNVCSSLEHGECSLTPQCINCKEAHVSTDKKCEQYRMEAAALSKANNEHLSVGYAKKLLGNTTSYARALVPLVSDTSKGPAPPKVKTQSPRPDAHTSRAKTPLSVTVSQSAEIDASKQASETISVSTTQFVIDDLSSAATQGLSQSESLPDLREPRTESTRKRVRAPSSSPPPPPESDTTSVLVQKTKKVDPKSHAATQQNKNDNKHRSSQERSSISRPSSSTSNKSHKESIPKKSKQK